MQSRIKPSKKLLESASQIIHEGKEDVFSLIEEQIVAKNVILDKINKNKDLEKSVVVVKGGPGTGKTVIALNILATLAKKNYKIHFATLFPDCYFHLSSFTRLGNIFYTSTNFI